MCYVGNYEKEVIQGGNTNEYDYICTPEGLSVIAVKTNGARSLYYVQTDHLGSVRVITNASKGIQTRYYYDAWGKQTLVSGTGITNRGYTGEEHLNDFGLINLNARLYDPVLGRFLEMDPYVTMPDYTQSFNRYSYALNNPLRYTDTNGKFSPIIPLIGFLLAKWYYDGYQANHKVYNPLKWNWSKLNYTLGYSSQGNSIIGGIGWNDIFSLGLGYSFDLKIPIAGYWQDGTPYMTSLTQQNYDPIATSVNESINKARQEFSTFSESFNNSFIQLLQLTTPVARSFSIGGEADAISHSGMVPVGVLILQVGPNAGVMTYSSGSLGVGWIGAGASIIVTDYYYLGNRNDLSFGDFTNWNKGELNLSADFGVEVGVGISYITTKSGGYLLGITKTLGVGVSPTIVNGNIGRTYTKEYKRWN